MSTLNQTIRQEDAFTRVDTDTVIPDAAHWLVATLRKEWKPENTNGEHPNVEFGEHTKGVTFREKDWVSVWGLVETSEPVTVTYSFTNDTLPVQLDFYTRHGRPHANKMIAEIRRIVEANKTDTFGAPDDDNGITGRVWMIWRRTQPYDTISKGWYRRTVDLEVRWRFRRVSA